MAAQHKAGILVGTAMAALGHEDQFWPPSLNGGCRLGKATFAGIGGKEEDAPKAAVLAIAIPNRVARP